MYVLPYIELYYCSSPTSVYKTLSIIKSYQYSFFYKKYIGLRFNVVFIQNDIISYPTAAAFSTIFFYKIDVSKTPFVHLFCWNNFITECGYWPNEEVINIVCSTVHLFQVIVTFIIVRKCRQKVAANLMTMTIHHLRFHYLSSKCNFQWNFSPWLFSHLNNHN